MRRSFAQSGMTLLEILVVLSTVLILAGALLGVGKYVVRRAENDLTESVLEVISTAIEQYYTDLDEFPFHTDMDGDGSSYNTVGSVLVLEFSQSDLQAALGGTVDTVSLSNDRASSAALFYYLDQNPNSRKIIDALNVSMIKSEIGGTHVTFTFTPGGTIDLPWFVDAWETVIRYEYLPDTAFPILTSAGPDKIFNTDDDIKK